MNRHGKNRHGRSGRGTTRRGMTRAFRCFAALLVLGSLGAAGVTAQDPGRRSPDRTEMERRLRAQMQRMVKERLQLTDEQANELAEVVRGFDERRRDLRRSEIATRRRIEALMLEGGDDEAEAEELLDRMVELRRQEAELFADEQRALRQILPATKVLQLQALRDEMGRRIRSLRRGDGERGRRRPGGGVLGGVVPSGNVDWIFGVEVST